jgi:hypothetical protein
VAKLRCICGTVLSNVSCPNTVEGYLIKDLDMEAADGRDVCGLMDIARGVWECHACGRLGFSYPNKEDSTVKWYVPEDGKPGALCGR